jgi:hypothetical protein
MAVMALACASCNSVPTRSVVSYGSISVDQPEIYDNAALESQLTLLRAQLAQLGVVDNATLTASLGNVQGTTLSYSGISVQAAVPATATVPTAPAPPSLPPTASTIASDTIGLINKQMELESQLQGYQLLLGGSDFARYTRNGLSKDRVVVGFPISIAPEPRHRNMAAVVQITYFPPNSGQFPEPGLCEQSAYSAKNPRGQTATEYRFSVNDEQNAVRACEEQEATPSIINILPTQHSYNVVGVTSRAQTAGIGAIIGTVNAGIAGAFGKQSQYLVAQQDTVALQGQGVVTCTRELVELATKSHTQQCVPGSRGISFRWQFRPVLGEAYVRAGIRRTFVQLAIPNVRRPYPYYGGIVFIKMMWRPFDPRSGVVSELPDTGRYATDYAYGSEADSSHAMDAEGVPVTVRNVFGHTFISSEVSKIETFDQGGGLLQVSLRGRFLAGATVRVGGTILSQTSPGFLADYNSLRFVVGVQTLAQNGAFLISTGGVESPIGLESICKDWDKQSECSPEDRPDPQDRPQIERVSVLPVSDSSSLVEVQLDRRLHLPEPDRDPEDTDCHRSSHPPYTECYSHYARDEASDVKGDLVTRDPNKGDLRSLPPKKLAGFVNKLPVVLTVGGKAYGLSDAPLQSIGLVDAPDKQSTKSVVSVVVPTDALNASPLVKVQTLFGRPEDDPVPQVFVPPGRVTVSPDPVWMAKQQPAPKQPDKPAKDGIPGILVAPAGTLHEKPKSPPAPNPKAPDPCDAKDKQCHYLVSGALVHTMFVVGGADKPDTIPAACKQQVPKQASGCGHDTKFTMASTFEHNSRGLVAPECARQVTLSYIQESLDNKCFKGELVVSLSGKSAAPAASVDVGIAKPPGAAPHFSLVRTMHQATESGGTASITVGIQGLKDQTATVTVKQADIVSAKDGAGNTLPVQAGNSVLLSQDANVTFQVRNYAIDGVTVTAEGKNNGVSSGVLSFPQPFNIVKSQSSGAGNAKTDP